MTGSAEPKSRGPRLSTSFWQRLRSSLQGQSRPRQEPLVLQTTSRRVGLSLSGGGALGAAHIGVLEALEHAGVDTCCVAGTSAGSLVGALYCAGISLSLVKEIALKLQWNQLGKVVRPRTGFFDGSRLEHMLIRLVGDRSFDQMIIPFACAAVDILRDEQVIFREGRVAPAVRASCAFPGVFTPVEWEGRLLVDGGLINNMPVSVLREMGAQYTIAVDLSATHYPRKAPTSLLEMWFMSLSTLTRLTNAEAALADVVIRPDIGKFNGFDLSAIPTLIERGRKAAEAELPRILHDLGMEDKVAA